MEGNTAQVITEPLITLNTINFDIPDFKLTTQIIDLLMEGVISVIKKSKKKPSNHRSSSKIQAKKQILQKSVPFIMNSFNATLSTTDQTLFELLKLYSQVPGINLETMPLFGPKSFNLLVNSSKKLTNNTNPNPLYIHSTRANIILTNCIDEKKAYHTALHYNQNLPYKDNPEIYNLEFILPLICHILNEKNICDGTKIVANGWIYFIIQGLSLENEILRKLACLAYQRLLVNFQQAKVSSKCKYVGLFFDILIN